MNFFFVINGNKLKKSMIIIVAILFTFGILYSEKESISVFSSNEPSAIFSVPTDKKMVALTFDISWGDQRAEPILNVLKEKEVYKATFFVSSIWGQTYPQILSKITDAGFEIGSLGHEHRNYSALEENEIREQIQTAHHILTSLIGKEPQLIRMPNGKFDQRVLRIADELKYKVIQWHTDPEDWKNPGVEKIIKRVIKRTYPGDIILMHASDSSRQTHEALPVIIDELRAKGYEFVTVSELIQQTEIYKQPVEDHTLLHYHI